MSIKLTMEVRALAAKNKELIGRLDNLEKSVNTLKRSVSHMERNPTGKSGIRVPQTALPDTLAELEIGKPQGT